KSKYYSLKGKLLTPPEQAAVITVTVPTEDTELFVGKTKLTRTGLTRRFVSPALDLKRYYKYDMKAVWMEEGMKRTQVRHVLIAAGAKVNVSFGEPGVEPKKKELKPDTDKDKDKDKKKPGK